jgi:hypothetical protein
MTKGSRLLGAAHPKLGPLPRPLLCTAHRPTPFGSRLILQECIEPARPYPSPLYTGERMGEGLEHQLRNEAPHPASPPSTGERSSFSCPLHISESVGRSAGYREREDGAEVVIGIWSLVIPRFVTFFLRRPFFSIPSLPAIFFSCHPSGGPWRALRSFSLV